MKKKLLLVGVLLFSSFLAEISAKSQDLDSLQRDSLVRDSVLYIFIEEFELKLSVSELLEAKELDFSEKSVAVLPEAFSYLNNLEELDLSVNYLGRANSLQVLEQMNVKVLKLSENNLMTLSLDNMEALSKISSLEEIDLSDNYLQNKGGTPKNFFKLGKLPNLKKLNFVGNKLLGFEGKLKKKLLGVQLIF